MKNLKKKTQNSWDQNYKACHMNSIKENRKKVAFYFSVIFGPWNFNYF